MLQQLTTEFASPERSTSEEIKKDVDFFREKENLRTFINAVPNLYMILNENRQVVFANELMIEYLNLNSLDDIYNKRPGEVLGCSFSSERQEGCGTTKYCKSCGAVKAILSSLEGQKDVQDCTVILNEEDDNLEFRVWTTPYVFEGRNFSIFTIQDISHEKRRRALERIFFHDVVNTAGGLKGFSELLVDADKDELESFSDIITGLSVRLIEEINSQKDLLAAESNELRTEKALFNTKEVLEAVNNVYKIHTVAYEKNILLDPESHAVNIISDKALMIRVVGNMLKNALEATPMEGTCTFGCKTDGEYAEFWVHNPSYIPEDIQLQIFRKSFSTKGQDRGLGTFSMRLLSRKYLGGTVRFESFDEKGTTFFAKYPLEMDE
jgi:Histidine kinase-, DNA gyrase B-, and HSP90-like ATPase